MTARKGGKERYGGSERRRSPAAKRRRGCGLLLLLSLCLASAIGQDTAEPLRMRVRPSRRAHAEPEAWPPGLCAVRSGWKPRDQQLDGDAAFWLLSDRPHGHCNTHVEPLCVEDPYSCVGLSRRTVVRGGSILLCWSLCSLGRSQFYQSSVTLNELIWCETDNDRWNEMSFVRTKLIYNIFNTFNLRN